MNQSTPSNERAEAQLRAEFAKLGLLPQQFDQESESPAVDELALAKLATGELPSAQATLLMQFVARYRNWYDAYLELLLKRFDNPPLEFDSSERESPNST